MTLMERLLDAGYPRDQMFSHESDLYVFVTPLTTRVVESWCKENGYNRHWNCPIFRDQVSGKPMYDCAFQYDDYWKDRHREEEGRAMKEFTINIRETLEMQVTVKAESLDDAIRKVKQSYQDEEYVLGAENCTSTEFTEVEV